MRLAVAGVLLVVIVGAGLGTQSYLTRDPPARRAADAWYTQARAARLQGEESRQFEFLLRAYQADPTYTPVFADLARHRLMLDGWPAIGRRILPMITRVRDRALAQCQSALLSVPRLGRERAAVHPGSSLPARECYLLYQVNSTDYGSRPAPSPKQIWELWQRYPQSAGLAEAVIITVSFANAWDSADELGRTMVQADADPFVRSFGYSLAYHAYQARKDDAGMIATDREANRWLASKPREVRWFYYAASSRSGLLPADSILTIKDPATRWEFLLEAAMEAYNNGKLPLSTELWDRAYHSYHAWPNIRQQALVYRGRTHLKAGELQLAQADLLLARATTDTTVDPGTRLEIDHNLFHVYEALGDSRAAIAAGTRFLKNADSFGRLINSFTALHDLGWYYWRLHDYERAAPLLQRMLAVIDSLGRYRYYAGEYYERIGDLERAMRAYQLTDSLEHVDARATAQRTLLAAQLGDSVQAIRLAHSHDDRLEPNYPEFTPLLPTVLANFGRKNAALAAAQVAERTAATRKQVAAVANLKLQRAELQISLGHAERALAPAESAAVLAHNVANTETELLARAQRALASAMLQKSRAPLDTLRALVTAAGSAKATLLSLRIVTLLGDALATRHDLAGALAAYRSAAEQNDLLAGSFDSDADRARFRGAMNDVSGRAIAAILRAGPPDSPRLFAQWSGIRKAHGLARPARKPLVPSVAADEAVLDYVVLDSAVTALLITPERTRVATLPLRADSLAAMVRRLRAALTPRIGTTIDLQRARFDYATARALYRGLIEPFAADLRRVQRLVIIPDGVLHELPFDALVSGGDRQPHYLVERFVIRTAPALQLTAPERAVELKHVLAIAGDAPDAEAEVTAVTQQLRGRGAVTALTGAHASETQLQAKLPGTGLLHFATHGTPNDVEPLFAYLSLAPGANTDGRLHGYEIERLKLAGSFVVLSGCDTGNGWIAGGEGVLSISRAFLRAGASATVATLWPVGAAATDFMRGFYTQLARGMLPSEALRNAKLQAITSRYSSPLYWAPFVLIST